MGPVERSIPSLLDLMHKYDCSPSDGRHLTAEQIYESTSISYEQYLAILQEWKDAERANRNQAAMREMDDESERLKSRMAHAGVPQRFTSCVVNNTQGRALDSGRWLYVTGTDVNRVTTEACGHLKGWLSRNGYGAATFASSPSVTSERGDGEMVRQCSNVGMLLLSGLGAEHPSSWAVSLLHQVLGHRFGIPLPTIITSRYQPEELASHLAVSGNEAAVRDIMDWLRTQSLLIQT